MHEKFPDLTLETHKLADGFDLRRQCASGLETRRIVGAGKNNSSSHVLCSTGARESTRSRCTLSLVKTSASVVGTAMNSACVVDGVPAGHSSSVFRVYTALLAFRPSTTVFLPVHAQCGRM